MTTTKWWDDPEVEKLYCVGQAFTGIAADGQKDGWMLEGIFKTEEEAILHCASDNHFISPVPVGMMIGKEIPDGVFWPKLQKKEDGLERARKHREHKQEELSAAECFETACQILSPALTMGLEMGSIDGPPPMIADIRRALQFIQQGVELQYVDGVKSRPSTL